MKDRILKLCKRLDKFSLDEILSISEAEESTLKLLLEVLISEKKLIYKDGTYFYCKKIVTSKNISSLPLFFQFHDKKTIDYIIRCFCSDIEIIKLINVFDISKNVLSKFYSHFRNRIYEIQFKELLEHYKRKPKLPYERIYMNSKVYLYLYNGKLFVSKKYMANKNSIKHTEAERLEIKNIYLRSYRKVLNKAFAHYFHLHLAEEIWKYGKEFKEQYSLMNKLLYCNISQ